MENKAVVDLLNEHSSIKNKLIAPLAENFLMDSCKTLVNDFDIDPASAHEAAYILLQNPDFKHTHMDKEEDRFNNIYLKPAFIKRFGEKIVEANDIGLLTELSEALEIMDPQTW